MIMIKFLKDKNILLLMTSEATSIDGIVELQKHIPVDFSRWNTDVHPGKAKIKLVIGFPKAYSQQQRLRELLIKEKIPFNFREGFFNRFMMSTTHDASYSGQFSNCTYKISLWEAQPYSWEGGHVTLVADRKGEGVQPLLTLLDVIKAYTATK